MPSGNRPEPLSISDCRQLRRSHATRNSSKTIARIWRYPSIVPFLRSIRTTSMPRGNLATLLFFQVEYAGAIPRLRAALRLRAPLWNIQDLPWMSVRRTGSSNSALADLRVKPANQGADQTDARKWPGHHPANTTPVRGHASCPVPRPAGRKNGSPDQPGCRPLIRDQRA